LKQIAQIVAEFWPETTDIFFATLVLIPFNVQNVIRQLRDDCETFWSLVDVKWTICELCICLPGGAAVSPN